MTSDDVLKRIADCANRVAKLPEIVSAAHIMKEQTLILAELADEVDKQTRVHNSNVERAVAFRSDTSDRIGALEKEVAEAMVASEQRWKDAKCFHTRIEALERGMCIGTHHIDHCPVHGDGGCP